MHEEIAKLIPELSRWNNGDGISVEGWTSGIARYDHLIGYSTILWPDFFLYDDCIFRYEPDPKIYGGFMNGGCKGDKTQVEAVMNHLHIADICINSEFKLTKEVAIHIGRLLQDMWSCKLRRDFPDRKTQVDFYGVGSDDLLDYQVTMVQAEHKGQPHAPNSDPS